jgi:hypothetical protein
MTVLYLCIQIRHRRALKSSPDATLKNPLFPLRQLPGIRTGCGPIDFAQVGKSGNPRGACASIRQDLPYDGHVGAARPRRRRAGPRGQKLGPRGRAGPPDGGGHPGPAIAPQRTRAATTRARHAPRGPALAGRRRTPAVPRQSIAARIPAASGCLRANSLSR